MSTTTRTSARTGWRRRLVALAGLVVVGSVALVVAPAPTASAGRNTSAVKIDNKTDGATLVVRQVSVEKPARTPWESAPAIGATVAPGRTGHWELNTNNGYETKAVVTFDIKDAGGATLGEVRSYTTVDGVSWIGYGSETNSCAVTGPFTCLANGRNDITVRDREYVEVGNRTAKLSVRLTGVESDTGLEPRPTEDLMRPGDKTSVSLNPNFGRMSRAYFTYVVLDANGNRVGSTVFEVSVTPEGNHVSNCVIRQGDYKCFSDGGDRVLFLDLSARPPAR
jgi:hypothetical protein